MNSQGLATLLIRWLHTYEQGEDLPPEQLCPDRPDQAAELAPFLEALRRLPRGGQETLAVNVPSGEVFRSGTEAATRPRAPEAALPTVDSSTSASEFRAPYAPTIA